MALTTKQIKDLNNMNISAQKAKLGTEIQSILSQIGDIEIILDIINGEIV